MKLIFKEIRMLYINNKLYNKKLFPRNYQEESNCYNLYQKKIKIKIHLQNKLNKIIRLISIYLNLPSINKI